MIALDLMKWTPERIKELRKRLGYNQTEMASALGYSRYQSVSDLENGKQTPSDTICRLLTMLDEFGDAQNRRLEDDEAC